MIEKIDGEQKSAAAIPSSSEEAMKDLNDGTVTRASRPLRMLAPRVLSPCCINAHAMDGVPAHDT